MGEIYGRSTKSMPLCGVHAVAVAADKPVTEVFFMFKKEYRKRDSWLGRVNKTERHGILDLIGIRWKPMLMGRGITLASWIDQHTVKGVTYIVETGAHVQSVCDGVVTDQCNRKPINKYRWKRCRVKSAIQILKEKGE